MPVPAVVPQLLMLFAALVEETAGVVYGPEEHDVLASKLTERATELGYRSLLDYYYRLRYDDPDGIQSRDN